MKISVALSIEVDEKAWADEYGIRPEEVREDVRSYARSAVSAQLVEVLGLASQVSLKS